MKRQYTKLIGFLMAGDDPMALNLLNGLTQIQVAAVIFMSQRSARREESQLVGDFILRQFGRDKYQGIKNIWENV